MGSPLGKIPWDLVVFVTVTACGFAFSIQHAISPDRSELASVAMVAPARADRRPTSTSLTKQTLDLGCVESRGPEIVTSEDGAIRVRGKFCSAEGKRKKFDAVRIRNASTGYEGTVFYQGNDNSFVTDFLILKQGRNLIEVEWQDRPNAQATVLVAEVFER